MNDGLTPSIEVLRWVEEQGGIEAVKKRLMPEGVEWPRFEDGEPVRLGDEFECWCGETHTVESVTIREGRSALNASQPHTFVVSNGPFTAHGERVKRPALKVLDADGVPCCIGDEVWDIHIGEHQVIEDITGTCGGYETLVVRLDSGKRTTCDAVRVSHRKPVLDAAGVPIKKGDVVWHVTSCREYVVIEPSYGETVVVRLAGTDDADGEQYAPEQLTHHSPVLDANGVPIKVGDTVWDIETGIEFEVSEVSGCAVTMSSGSYYSIAFPRYCPSKLSHTKPEIDSWERIEEDAKLAPGDYIEKHGRKTDLYAYEEMPIDLVRRAKALAERGEQ